MDDIKQPESKDELEVSNRKFCIEQTIKAAAAGFTVTTLAAMAQEIYDFITSKE